MSQKSILVKCPISINPDNVLTFSSGIEMEYWTKID